VQVAAFDAPEPARNLVARLKARGHDARVDGTARPFRVRIGRYPSRAAAATAQRALESAGIDGYVVGAVRP